VLIIGAVLAGYQLFINWSDPSAYTWSVYMGFLFFAGCGAVFVGFKMYK
jgi:uncharacterized membrane protein